MTETPQSADDDWSVPCSDDEKYEISREDMADLFELVAKNESLVLEWICPGRRSPTPEPAVESLSVEEKMEVKVEPQQKLVFILFIFYCFFSHFHLSGFEFLHYCLRC